MGAFLARIRRAAAPLLLVLVLFGGGAPVRGEDATTAPKPGDPPIDELVVIGESAQRPKMSPSAFESSIEFDDYAGERQTVADLLSEEVGVQLRRFGGPGDPAQVSIRGSTDSQVVVELDGIRLNSVLTGGTDVSQLCLGLLDSATITRGGASLAQGQGAIGGSIGFETRRPEAESEHRARVYGGAFDTWEVDALRSGRAGPLDYTVGYCAFTTEGDYRFARPEISVQTRPPTERPAIERINNEQVRHSTNVSLGGETGSVGYLRLGNYFTYQSRGEPGLDSGDGPEGGQNPFAHSRSVQNVAQIEWRGEDLGVLGDDLRTRLFHRYQRLDFDDPGVSVTDEPIDTLTQVHSVGLHFEDDWSLDLLGARNTVTLLGRSARDVLVDEDRPDRARSEAGAALRLDSSWLDDRILLVSGVRLEWVQRLGEFWLPAAGIVISPWPWLQIQANVQESFRAPSFDELFLPDKGFIRGNPDLDPEEARNIDVGIVLDVPPLGPLTDLRLEASYFQQDIDDSIVFVPVSPRTIEPNNTGRARVRGYELSLEFALTRFLRLKANHTGLESESRTTGLPLPGRAENETLVRLEIGEERRWKLVGEMQRTDEIPVTASGSLLLPSRVVWSGSAAINLAAYRSLPLPESLDVLWLSATLNNIGDVAVRDSLFFPQPGRSGFLGLEVEF